MRTFEVLFSIRKGLGPESFDKTISIGLDDLPGELSENEIRDMAKAEAESFLYKSEDYYWYGKNWMFKEIYES